MKPLFHALQAFEKSLRPQRKDTDAIVNGALRYVRENIAANNGACFLATDGGNAIGFIAGWVEESDGLDSGTHHVGLISDIFVLSECRRSGVFKNLLDEMEKYFRAQAVDRLVLESLATNMVMRDCAAASGFMPHKIRWERALSTI